MPNQLVKEVALYQSPSEKLKTRRERIKRRIIELRNSSTNVMDIDYTQFDFEDQELKDDTLDMINVPFHDNDISHHNYFGGELKSTSKQNISDTSSIISSGSSSSSCFSYTEITRKSSATSMRPSSSYTTKTVLERELSAEDALKLAQQNNDEVMLLKNFMKLNGSVPSIESKGQTQHHHMAFERSDMMKHPQKIFSSTRPFWLPPKLEVERTRHRKEAEELFHVAIRRNTRALNDKIHSMKHEQDQHIQDKEIWRELDPQQIKELSQTKDTRALYLRGIPSAMRGYVWDMMLSSKFEDEEIRTQDKDLLKDLLNEYEPLRDYNKGTLYIRPTLKKLRDEYLFHDPQISEHIQKMTQCLKTFLEIRLGISSDSSKSTPQAGLWNALRNIVAVFCYVFGDMLTILYKISCIFTRSPLQRALIITGYNEKPSTDELAQKYLSSLTSEFEMRFPRLHSHFNSKGVSITGFEPLMNLSFLSNLLDMELCLRLIDIWIYEGDFFILQAIFTYIEFVQHKLYGSKEEIFSFFHASDTSTKSLDITSKPGFSFDFFDSIQKSMRKSP